MNWWNDFVTWMYSFGAYYGVDPLIFAILYFGTIPFNVYSLVWLGQRMRLRRSPIPPLLLLFFSWVGTYVYLFSVGKNIPWWVYAVVVGVMLYSAGYLIMRIQKLRDRYRE